MPNPITMATLASRDESDNDSSSSSVTIPDSSRSWMSNLSFAAYGVPSPSLLYLNLHSPLPTSHTRPTSCMGDHQEVTNRQWRVGLDHFLLLRRLGSGDLGNVYLCQIRNPVVGLPQCFYAMKVCDKEALAIRNKLQRAQMEKEILGLLDHLFLPTLYAEFEASHYSCLVMSTAPVEICMLLGNASQEGAFPISSAKFYAAETLLALEYLHMMGIVYRDLSQKMC
ncbi:hypothetical protein GH714_041297 [Hevea brasiliensis]|uniref:non-specific serine/threonine protein kinase n=1 Tax=Hevea brasiliensis TaxID=3981 RepID=A0A6A6N0K5_HEVBR|nr:hypothetical protein GH714_041297 [Hevea brasiliensis]